MGMAHCASISQNSDGRDLKLKLSKQKWVVILVFLWLAPGSFSAASPVPGPGGKELSSPPPVSSPWRNREFSLDPVQIRQALLELLEVDGLKIQEPTGEEDILRTGLIEFGQEKFGENVSSLPPKASNEYPFFQDNQMKSGQFGLEVMIRDRGDGSTRIQLRALLEARALDRRSSHWRWVPRRSNGAIENSYFSRLTQKLKPALTSNQP